MKLIKSLLLGAAAGFVGVASVQAADLPSKTKGPAVEYVKICDWVSGTGFFVIPGTETCLKVGGYVRAQFDIRNVRNTISNYTGLASAPTTVTGTVARLQDTQGFHARGTATLDARTRSAYGTVRAFMALEANNRSGTLGGNAFNVDKAFIQFAGITAGRAESFFEFWDAYADNTYVGLQGSANSSDLFAYTVQFGGGFQATIAAEHAPERNNGYGVSTVLGTAGTSFTNAGNIASRTPDVVGQLYLEQGWGKAQISAAFHQSTSGFVANGLGGTATYTANGYAVLAGVSINLPMLAAGDFLLLQGVYANGAGSYLGAGSNLAGQGLIRNDADFAVVNGVRQNEKGYNLIAEMRHYWAPTFYQGIFASYLSLTPGSAIQAVNWNAGGLGKFNEWRVGTQFVWVPVAGLTLGVEGLYAKSNNTLAGSAASPASVFPVGFKKDYDTYIGRVRINRAF